MSETPSVDDSTDSVREDPDPVEPELAMRVEEKPARVGLPKPRGKRWGMNPEDRMRVMEACMVLPGPGWVVHFSLMMSMSVIVAIMGLSLDSPALVIGAMLIAPLMTPVLGIAASIAMALGDAVTRSVVVVVSATLGAISVSYLIAGLLPGELLTSEVLARTAPDARDLVVALAAGIAGSYATARPDVSSSLPGVAIAVALVPPLAVVGITLRAGEGALAWGALLLYATNLAAIVTVSTVVFVAAGFVPGHRLLTMAPRVIAGGLAALVVVAILGVLLGTRSYNSAQRSTQVTEIRSAARTWLEGTFNESVVNVDGNRVRVTVTGPTELPASSDLRAEIAEILGDAPELSVTWIQGQTTATILAAEEARNRTAEQQARADEISAVVEQWLGSTGDANVYDMTALDIGDETVNISITSTVPPPELADLESRILQQLGEPVPVAVNWEDLSAGEAQRQIAEAQGVARGIVQDFANERGLAVDSVKYDGRTVVADVRGQVPPDGAQLEQKLRDALGPEATINVFFIERVPVIPAPTPTPTPTPEPTATPVPTPTPTPTPAPTTTPDTDTTPDPATTPDPNGTADGG